MKAWRLVLPLLWRGLQAAICVVVILLAGGTAIPAGWDATTGPGRLGDRVLWAGLALGSAGVAVWFASNLLRTLGFRRGWRAMGSSPLAIRAKVLRAAGKPQARDGGG